METGLGSLHSKHHLHRDMGSKLRRGGILYSADLTSNTPTLPACTAFDRCRGDISTLRYESSR